jgi:hypothetical protein
VPPCVSSDDGPGHANRVLTTTDDSAGQCRPAMGTVATVGDEFNFVAGHRQIVPLKAG